jgi:hypothetical protein
MFLNFFFFFLNFNFFLKKGDIERMMFGIHAYIETK